MRNTDSGRQVFGGGGITPDIKIPATKATTFQQHLAQQYAFFNFAKHYLLNRHVQKSWEVDDATLQEFKGFLQKQQIAFTEPEFNESLDWVKANIKSEIAPTDEAGIDALHLKFGDSAGSINPYSSSGDINVRVHKSDWSLYDQIGNFSFRPDTTLTDWNHVGLYRAGVLVWGSPPEDAGGTGT